MKNFIYLFIILGTTFVYGQENTISFLDLVGNHIQVPKGCVAQSEYEMLACNGTSIKWEYYSEDMLSAVFEEIISIYGDSSTIKTEIKFVSFGSELKGYKFKMGNTYQFFLKGKIKDQALMINLGTPSDISVIDDLDGFLRTVFDEVG